MPIAGSWRQVWEKPLESERRMCDPPAEMCPYTGASELPGRRAMVKTVNLTKSHAHGPQIHQDNSPRVV